MVFSLHRLVHETLDELPNVIQVAWVHESHKKHFKIIKLFIRCYWHQNDRIMIPMMTTHDAFSRREFKTIVLSCYFGSYSGSKSNVIINIKSNLSMIIVKSIKVA